MAENSQAVIPDNLIIVDGEIGGGVPSSSASDAGKVLAVDSNGDPSWVTPSGGTQYTEGNGIDISDQNVVSIDTEVVATKSDLSGLQGELTAGTGIDITSDTISVDTSVIATQSDISGLQPSLTAGDNISISNNTISATDTTYTAGTGLSLTGTEFAVDTTVIATKTDLSGIDEVPAVTSTDDGKVLTATYSGGTGSFAWATPSGGSSGNVNEVFNWSTVTATDIATCLTNGHNPIIQYDYSADKTQYAYLEAVEPTSSGTAYSFYTPVSGSSDNGEKVMARFYLTTWGTKNVNRGVRVSTPASSSTDSGKVLTVNSHGSQVWSTPSGGTTYTAGNMISLANDAVAVSTTAGITDIQQVASLPANPVATVLYLIPSP